MGATQGRSRSLSESELTFDEEPPTPTQSVNGDSESDSENESEKVSFESESGVATGSSSWQYEGPRGPRHWRGLSITGRQQSPINLQAEHAITFGRKKAPVHEYVECQCRLINTGKSVKIESSEMGTMALGGSVWEMDSFHFHSPAEHTIDGVRHPLEGHFVHKNEEGKLAVVGILYEESDINNPFLAQFTDDIPMTEGQEHLCTIAPPTFEAGTKYFRYEGSLTTPPCTEQVTWSVVEQTQSVTKNQLSKFNDAVPFNNYRPLQDLNGRVVELC